MDEIIVDSADEVPEKKKGTVGFVQEGGRCKAKSQGNPFSSRKFIL